MHEINTAHALHSLNLRATYRIQFNHRFTFNDATRIVPYLAQLGISHVYASPILKARPGSEHGYDVVDHNTLNPELGTRADFETFVAQLHQHHMGLIVDIVPNHLGVMGKDNAWWLDVLENGPAAESAEHFDIDWNPARYSMRNRLLVPVLGDAHGTVLERGELQLHFDAQTGTFSLHYFEHLFPIDPREYPRIFCNQQQRLAEVFAEDDPHRADFESLLDALTRLPARSETSPAKRLERYRDKEVHKRRLVRLCERSPAITAYIHAVVNNINGRIGEPSSFDALGALLEAQAYRLSFWRVATDEINFRRFFDINDLAALRMQDEAVFEATHAFIFSLIAAGLIDGLRIDHPDGLYDPAAYFEKLHNRAQQQQQYKPLYVVVEKILAAHERLPNDWSVHGTTGYDFAALVNSWLTDARTETKVTKQYHEFIGHKMEFDELAYQSKKLIMRISLAAEIGVLATQLDRIAQLDRHTADFTRNALREVIVETIACFPVYRTYISARGVSEEDQRIIQWAINVAKRRSIAADLSAFDFLRDVLLGQPVAGYDTHAQQAMLEFAMKFQQVSSPVMAKGVEDTASYIYNRLTSLNEVGADLKRFNVSTNAIHLSNQERAQKWPWAMLNTSTHDSKRSEDVRARIAVLSELPELWRQHLARWKRLNASKRRQRTEGPAPSRNDEYLIYQTLLGVWPQHDSEVSTTAFITRMQDYSIKAAREAKCDTSWLNPDIEYEQALADFIAKLLERSEHNAFLHDFARFANHVAFFGHLNSLSQTILKLTVPGVPDLYQGTELPALSLVDPDNRRAVNFTAHQQHLQTLMTACPNGVADPAWLEKWLCTIHDGNAKFFVTWATLQLRHRQPALFTTGKYEPLRITGPAAEYLCAFARTLEDLSIVVVVARWFVRLLEMPQSSHVAVRLNAAIVTASYIELPQDPMNAHYCNVFSGATVRVSCTSDMATLPLDAVLHPLPVAILQRLRT